MSQNSNTRGSKDPKHGDILNLGFHDCKSAAGRVQLHGENIKQIGHSGRKRDFTQIDPILKLGT